DAGVRWTRVEPQNGIGSALALTGSGPVFALSTAPGQAPASGRTPQVIWRSGDGVEWTSAATLSGDSYITDLAASGDRVYAVGTAPGTSAVGTRLPDIVAGWSDDGAKTFHNARLPLDVDSLTGPGVASVHTGQTHVAVRPHAVVATAHLRVALNA